MRILLISSHYLSNLMTRLTIRNSVKVIKRFTGKDKIPGKFLEYEKALLEEEIKPLLYTIKLFEKKVNQDEKYSLKQDLKNALLNKKLKENEK